MISIYDVLGCCFLKKTFSIEYRFTPDSVSTTEKSTLTWHRIVEAMKFAYAKRSSLRDPDMESQSFKNHIHEVELLYVVVENV